MHVVALSNSPKYSHKTTPDMTVYWCIEFMQKNIYIFEIKIKRSRKSKKEYENIR